ncbi:DNA-packaging protein [Methylobacterium sp. J-070]|uniref:DNA-packaging protein n=1 Tax=Methylobacterium sp. J-070 TaxID=2836650 RepID=UPI001FBA08AC|nr:terminase family protein [Methylobacterium sp. J-070]MCJ2048532.1 terminase family protein [Methylobacterium sp. J-070]
MTSLAALALELADALETDWRSKARPEQIHPPGDWATWLVLAGRGYGKTRMGAEWVQERAMSGSVSRIGLVAPTAPDARDVMIEGASGIMAIAPKHARPDYQPALRRLTWPNGCVATAFSAEEPDRLRGPQHGALWADELAAWPDAHKVWEQCEMGLRLGRQPQALITTTPRPIPVIRDLLSREGVVIYDEDTKSHYVDVIVTRGKTADNIKNLAPRRVRKLYDQYGGTRLGRQELEGEVLTDTPGALWRLEDIDRTRLPVEAEPDMKRVVVAVDPAVSSREKSNLTGLVVAGVDADGHFYVLADRSDVLTPDAWGQRAVALYRAFKADRIVCEVNQGGDMVESTIRNVDPNAPVRKVHASRGKAVRAEPVAALYEQGRVHHVGEFRQLEDQCCSFTSDFDRRRAGYSPDRLDALVWALTELSGRGQIEPDVIIEPVGIRNEGGTRLDLSWSLGSYEMD